LKGIIEVAIIAMVSIISITTIVLAENAVDVTGSFTNLEVCDIDATEKSLNFGAGLKPRDVSADQMTTVSQPSGNAETATLEIKGTPWSDGTHTMDAEQTHWSIETITDFSGGTALTADFVPVLSGSFTHSGTPVHFVVKITDNQPAGTYSQTITFQVSCESGQE